MNPLVELLLGFGAIALLILVAAGLVWGWVEMAMWVLRIVS